MTGVRGGRCDWCEGRGEGTVTGVRGGHCDWCEGRAL